MPNKQKAGWTQGPVWTFRRRGKSLALPGIELRFLGFRARSLVSIPTTLSRLPVSVCSTIRLYEVADIMRKLQNLRSGHMRKKHLYTSGCQHVPPLKLLKRFRINLVLIV